MILGLFNTADVDALADELTRDVLHRIPPSTIGASGKKAESKQARTRQVILQRAAEFSNKSRLNIYTKARLANRFKWSLLDAGYPREFVDSMAYELAAVMATRSGVQAKGK